MPVGTAPRLSIDPRILQRRIEHQRKSGRRRLRILLVGLGALVSLGGSVAVLHSPLVRVRRLQVSGASHVSTAEIASAIGIGLTTPMVDINPAKAEEVLERLPWVASAVVRRDWPGTLEISLVQRVPVAQVGTESGGWDELDVTGRVLEASATGWSGLVKLMGFGIAGRPGSTLSGAQAALGVAAIMPASVRSQVSEVVSQPGGELGLQLFGGGNVELGGPTDMAAKMQSLSTLLAQVDLSGTPSIDVQAPEAPTLTQG